jgi:small subunit ribosomal protein S5
MEDNKVVNPAPAAKVEAQKPVEAPKAQAGAVSAKPAARPAGQHSFEPHGSQSAGRPGDRKFGDHKGRPGERRGGRGGFRRDEDEYQERVVDINRISRVVQGGKHIRFDALVVIGDGAGKYGFALCKSGEVPDAIKKSLAAARKEMFTIHLSKGTIAHPVIGVYGDTKVFLKPAPAGTGIVAGGAVRAILELAGVKNVYSKVYGSRTPINVIRATHAGLMSMKNYDTVMVLRGLKTPEEIKAMHPAPVAKPAARPDFHSQPRPAFNARPAAKPAAAPAPKAEAKPVAPVAKPTEGGK